MKFPPLLVFLLLLTTTVTAQVIDDTELKQLQSGEYGLESGQIQAIFIETIHPDSALAQLKRKGYTITRTDFKPIMLNIEGKIPENKLKALQEHKWVDRFINEAPKKLLDQQQKKDSTLNKILENTDSMPPQLSIVQLKMEATGEAVNDLRTQFPELTFKISWAGSRSVVIETEPGTEIDVMDELKNLDIIESTAMMGMLKERH